MKISAVFSLVAFFGLSQSFAAPYENVIGMRILLAPNFPAYWKSTKEKKTVIHRRQVEQQLADQTVEIIKRRVFLLTGFTPNVLELPHHRLQVDLPKFTKQNHLAEEFAPPEVLSFHLVAEKVTAEQIRSGDIPADVIISGQQNSPIPVYKERILSGPQIKDVINGFDERTNEPLIVLRFDENSAQRIAEITRKNVGRRIAIVLGNKVLAAPMIREPLQGNSIQVSGGFTQQESADLAAMLRGSTVLAPFNIISINPITQP